MEQTQHHFKVLKIPMLHVRFGQRLPCAIDPQEEKNDFRLQSTGERSYVTNLSDLVQLHVPEVSGVGTTFH